jgi:hypothetical protein
MKTEMKSSADIHKWIIWFEKRGIPYQWELSNHRWVLKSEGRADMMSKESIMPGKEINFIGQVKKYILKDELYKKVPNKFKTSESKGRIKYFGYSKKHLPGTFFKACYEVDLKSAYWEILNGIGMLSPELYEKGKTVEKKTRLAAVGSLAKKTTKGAFDGKKHIKLETHKSPLTRHIWDYVCHKAGIILQSAFRAAGDDSLFFWVDALYVRDKEAATKIHAFIKNMGFESSIKPVEWIKFLPNKILIKNFPEKLKNNSVQRSVMKMGKMIYFQALKDGICTINKPESKFSATVDLDSRTVNLVVYKRNLIIPAPGSKNMKPYYVRIIQNEDIPSSFGKKFIVELNSKTVTQYDRIRPFPYTPNKKVEPKKGEPRT